MTYHFVDFLIVAIKGHGLGSLNAITLQNLEWGVCIAGKEREGEGKGRGRMEGRQRKEDGWMKRKSRGLLPQEFQHMLILTDCKKCE